jgi:hypothetical protein
VYGPGCRPEAISEYRGDGTRARNADSRSEVTPLFSMVMSDHIMFTKNRALTNLCFLNCALKRTIVLIDSQILLLDIKTVHQVVSEAITHLLTDSSSNLKSRHLSSLCIVFLREQL